MVAEVVNAIFLGLMAANQCYGVSDHVINRRIELLSSSCLAHTLARLHVPILHSQSDHRRQRIKVEFNPGAIEMAVDTECEPKASERQEGTMRTTASMNPATYLLAVLTVMTSCISSSADAQTLKAIKDRGSINCGVSEGLYGFSARDAKGEWSGFDVDLCRAIAAAIFNDTSKINYISLSTANRLTMLQSGDVDVLSRNTTWTMSREIEYGIVFVATNYYDGQGFLIRKAMNKETALDLNDARVCLQSGTTTELNLADYFRANKMTYERIGSATAEVAVRGYDSGICNVLTADVSQLFAIRLLLSKPEDHVILPDVISKEPLGPAVRQGDAQWFNIVKWVHFAMINAEELGVTSKNIDDAMTSDKADVRRLIGAEGNYGERIGLTKDWAAQIIKLVGNYGEVFERTVGVGSALGIPRGINQLWVTGGIQYAPPIR